MAITKCTGCGSVDWDMLRDGLCEVCNYEEFTRLQSENVKLKNLIKDIRKVDNFARPHACVLQGRCWAAELKE